MSWDNIKQRWLALRRKWDKDWKERREDLADEVSESGWYLKLGLALLVILAPLTLVLAILWSAEPQVFSVTERTRVFSEERQLPVVTGSHTSITLHELMKTLLSKPGGFLSNDFLPPGSLMDNMPNWEYGVLVQCRDMAKALREAFSRSQSQSPEVKDLARAESRFNFDNHSWAVPASESEYREGMAFLRKYILGLGKEGAQDVQFYARADNLRYWLGTVQSRLGSLSQRLSASVGQRRLNTDLAGDPGAAQATVVPREQLVKTPWLQVDDIFYEARGSSWALLHFLQAIDQDFAEVLERKRARVSLRQIIRELEATQQPLSSPMVLNGDSFGVFANYSLVMASYISRANAALIDLRDLLAKG